MFDKIIFLGDVTDYGAEPNECISRLREFDGWFLAGNHDLVHTEVIPLGHMHGQAQDCSRWTDGDLTGESFRWLEGLSPEYITPEFHLVHGSPINPALDYITSVDKSEQIFANWTFDLLFHGHSHVPILFTQGKGYALNVEGLSFPVEGGRHMINPGSVGQPRDGDKRAAYGIYEDGIFTWKRVEYDIANAQKKIVNAGLPYAQADRLYYGQ